jgi:glycosyltransferase involved in cell wall biosynthesis
VAAPEDKLSLSKHTKVSITKFEDTYHLGDDNFLLFPQIEFDATEKSIFFFGTLSWEANLDGLCWFIQNVWPLLKKAEPNIIFYIIGKNPPSRLKKLAHNSGRIRLTGFVEDLDTYMSKCRVFVNPVRFGSGIKVKMLDAFYRGVPSVSSPTGIESLDVTHGAEVFIASEPQAWVQAIRKLLNDSATWLQLSQNARRLAKEKYRWEPMLAAHQNSLNKLISKPKSEHVI